MKILHAAWCTSRPWALALLGSCVLAMPTNAGVTIIAAVRNEFGVDIPLPYGTQQSFEVANKTGKEAYDIEILWLKNSDGNPVTDNITSYSDAGDTDPNKPTERASMDEAAPGHAAPNNPIKYRVGHPQTPDGQPRRLADGKTVAFTNTFGGGGALTNQHLHVSFTDANGSLLAMVIPETEPNDSPTQANSLVSNNYTNASVSPTDQDYYYFYALEDNTELVSLGVPTSSSHTLLELLDTNGVTVLASATGSTNLALNQRLGSYGTYYVRVSNPVESATYSLDQSITYPEPIPTVSEWGLIILALLLLTVGTMFLLRHRGVTAVASGG